MKTIPSAAFATLFGCLLVGGCASGPDVPVLTPTTMFDVTGNEPFEYKAPADGFVNLNDVNQDRTLFSGPIEKDQVFSVDPVEQTVSIGRKMAKSVLVPRGDQMQILYRATAPADSAS
jgi:hypothetical protein